MSRELECDKGCGAELMIGRGNKLFGVGGICVFVNRA
jgi:hypothetical protein